MKIGIIGTGNMARGFVKRLASISSPIFLGARDPAKALQLAEQFHGVRASSISEVVAQSDLLVPALPYEQLLSLLPTLNLAGKTLIDITNPITPDYRSLTIGFS